MPQTTRTFRLFVSSTFSDLKQERNALQKYVFPRLRELAMAHGCRFQAIDLRWGVSEEAALDQQTMKICLTEIERCQKVSPRPNFLILLGDRFGWRPLPYAIPAIEFEKILPLISLDDQRKLCWREEQPDGEKGWYRKDENAVPVEYLLQPRKRGTQFEDYQTWELAVERPLVAILEQAAIEAGLDENALVKYTQSATGQEIVNGALKAEDAEEHVFGFFRSITNLPDVANSPAGSSFIEKDSDLQRRQQSLKTRLKDLLPRNIEEFPATWQNSSPSTDHIGSLPESLDDCLKLNRSNNLCEAVWLRLSRVILSEMGKLEVADPLKAEIEIHQRFCSERVRHFTGRTDLLQQVKLYLENSNRRPLVLWGESGSGKSALLAAAIRQAEVHHPNALILSRFIGASPASTSGSSLLAGLCRQIAAAVQSDPSLIPFRYTELVQQFPAWLAKAAAIRPIIVFLDALDQLTETDNARSLAWLPSELPPHVHFVVTTIEGDVLEQFRARQNPALHGSLLEVTPLDEITGEQILDRWLMDAGRCLADTQKRAVLSSFRQNGLPLFLKLAFEQAVQWKSFDPLITLVGNVPEITSTLLANLERPENHGQVLVAHALGLLSVSRNGLSEDEMLDLLWVDEEVRTDFFARSPNSPRDVTALPIVVWARLFADLEPYLSARSADQTELMNFYHAEFGRLVKKRYASDQAGYERLNALANYFDYQPWWLADVSRQRPNARKVAELPYLRLQAGQWSWAIEVLCAPDFFTGYTLIHKEDYHELMRFWSEAKQQSASQASLPGMKFNLKVGDLYHQAWQPVIDREEYAAVCGTLGAFLMEIGELDAAAFFTKVEQNLAPVDAYLSAANLNDLGLNAYRQGNFGEAEEKYQAAIRLIERDGSSEAAAVYVNLADVFMKTGRVDDAESLLNEALALRLRHNGERTPETATVLQAFGNLNMQRKEYLESLKYHQEALEIRKQCLGPDHVDVGRSLYNVSAILFNLGKFCESIRTTRQAQEILCKTWQQGDQRLQVVDQLIESYTGLTEALTAHPTTTGIVIPVWSGSTGIIAAENSLPAREALSQAVTRFANAMLARRAGLPILLLSLSGFENLPAELASLWSEFGLPANMVESITVPHSNKPDGKLDMGVIRELSVIPGRFARWVANNRLETLIVSPLHIPAGIDWTLVEYVKTCGKAMVSELMPFGPVWGPLVGAKNLGGGQTKVAFITPGSCQRQGYSPQPADSVSTGIFYLNLIKIKNMLVESSQENSGLLKNLLKQQKSTDLNKSLQSKISTALSEAEANPQTGQEIADWLFCELVDLFGTALVNDLSEKRNIRYDLLPDHRTH